MAKKIKKLEKFFVRKELKHGKNKNECKDAGKVIEHFYETCAN